MFFERFIFNETCQYFIQSHLSTRNCSVFKPDATVGAPQRPTFLNLFKQLDICIELDCEPYHAIFDEILNTWN